MHSPTGPESLPSHYWNLLSGLVATTWQMESGYPDLEVARSLEKAEELAKLEAFMVVAWWSDLALELVKAVEGMTPELFRRRRSALPRLEGLWKSGTVKQLLRSGRRDIARERSLSGELRRICDEAREGQTPSEPPPP